MNILSIKVKNFRSIQDEITIPINQIGHSNSCVLLGINESGKSSLLHAIALLSDDEGVDYEEDCNKEAQDKGECIEVTYNLDVSLAEKYKDKFTTIGIPQDLVGKIRFTEIQRKILIEPSGERNDFYDLWIKDSDSFQKYVFSETGEKVRKIEPRTATNEQYSEDGTIENLVSRDELEVYLSEELFRFFEADLPEVVFWRPLEDKYLINKPIDLNLFKENQSISVPLKNCFHIAGWDTAEKIKSKIDSIVGKTSKAVELQQKLGQSVTNHINQIWSEHNISITFAIDSLQLSFLVEDKDNNLPKYAVPQRSDGFRHFISILLNLSAENKAQILEGKLILLDEPEIHLHPSGQRYLKDELLQIAQNNIVIYATHSIYMVDTKYIGRHFSVKKQEGKTVVLQVEPDNPYREEVLYEALGTSILEMIEPQVLLVEGKLDRDVFALYLRKFKKELKSPTISLISADGSSNVVKYTKFFNTKLVKGYVLVDSDDAGVAQKDIVLKEYGYTRRNTFEINDLYDTKKQATLEDLFDKKVLIDTVKQFYGLEVDFDSSKPLINELKSVLQAHSKMYREIEKESIREIYFKKISRLTHEELKKQPFFTLVKVLCSKIGS